MVTTDRQIDGMITARFIKNEAYASNHCKETGIMNHEPWGRNDEP